MIPVGKIWILSAAVVAGLSLGCRSAFVETTIVNHSGAAVRLIEVDYPSASFGTQQITDGSTFKYRFKVQDTGLVTINYTGEDNKAHTSTGPTLTEGEQGTLTITFANDGKVIWTPELSASK